MKDINLQEFCKELHIYEFGIAPWPLPENAKTILYETNPCPFTAADVEERLLGTTEFTPKSAIVCLFPYYVEHNVHPIYPAIHGAQIITWSLMNI